MCRDLDLTILRLIRTRQGPISLGRLAPGRIRRLDQQEAAELRFLVGLETDPHSGSVAGRTG
jgi:23S rRNA pseudouridine2605 synthase